MFTELKIPAGRRPLTRAEARISAIIGAVFAFMMIAVVFEEFSPKKLSIVFLVLFWVPMLVLHELGHAVMAKLLGWRVREIVIGFGRDLWQWQLGETRVKIKLAPVEGYVLPAPVDPSRVRIKSMLIYAAGPGAELLLLALLIVAFGWDGVFNDSEEVPLIALQSLAIVILIGAGFNLLPFRSEGAVSDGLGIISSPFMPEESIQLRLLTFELREIQKLLDAGTTDRAVTLLSEQLRKYPNNFSLQLLYASALSADGQDDSARKLVRDKLVDSELAEVHRGAWLHLQAQVELDADEPSFLVLDLALQEALEFSPNAADLMASKGASLVMRGRNKEGGDMLADAWRRNEGGGDDARMLAYLTIAAHRCGDRTASEHFRQAFEHVNRSKSLRRRVDRLAGKFDYELQE